MPSVGAPSIYHNSDSASSTTKSAVEEGTLTVRDKDKQQQNIDELSRNTEDANNPLAQIFDKQQELDKIEQQQLINDIAAQMKDVANKYDRIQAQNDLADKKDQMLKDAEEQYADMSEDEKKLHGSAEEYANQTYYDAVTQQVNDNARKNIGGMGSDYSKGIDAATSVITGILTGNIAGGLAGAGAPYIAEEIKKQTGHYDADSKTWEMDDPKANLVAHAILGAVVAQLQGNSALVGVAGAPGGEAIAGIIIKNLYGDRNPADLSESEKQNISNLTQLALGLATALATGGDMGDTGTAVNAGKNAVENNYLSVAEAERKKALEIKENYLGEELTEAEKQEKADLDKKDKEREQYIKDNCSLGSISSPACQGASQEAWDAKSQYDDDFNYILKYRDIYRDDAAAMDAALAGLSPEDVQHLNAIEAIAKESGRNVEDVAEEYRLVMQLQGITSSLAGVYYGIKGNTVLENKVPKVTTPTADAGKGINGVATPVKPGTNFAPDAKPNLTVNMNQQNKHIVGTNENKTANMSASIPRSTIEPNIDVQKLVSNYAGTGDVKGKVPLGQPGSKENISTNQVIGKYYDQNSNTFVPTKNFTIHYSKTGVHIVPARP